MRLFACDRCGQIVYFENVSCTRCGAELGFAVDELAIRAVAGASPPVGPPRYRHCANRQHHQVCNWLIAADAANAFCLACRLNRTIPDLAVPGHRLLWQRLETEKRRLAYGLLRLGLPVVPKTESPAGLAFDFLADAASADDDDTGERIMTGHAGGLITLNLAEADPVARERMRAQMGEPYRTILGHFRHESGHYYWDRLVRDGPFLAQVREVFGDDTIDYGEALAHHYRNGPPADWPERCVSAYASMHAWEDWAETWAHYLHIIDTLETAAAFGLRVRPGPASAEDLAVEIPGDLWQAGDFQIVLEHWLPLTYALNSLNRSMGHDDAYPFVLPTPVIAKLELVHRIVQASRR